MASAPLSVLLIDLDDFTLLNDTHGHLAGDRVLRQVADLLRDGVRAQRVAGRLLARAETARIAIGELLLPLRLSVGIATFPRHGATRQELVANADSAMYAAKQTGGRTVGELARMTRSLEATPLGSLTGLVRAVDRKDRYTKDHSDLVTELAVRFARDLDLAAAQIEALAIAAPLHDVGKIAVPDAVLRKPGQLTAEEQETLRHHVECGALMVKGVPHLDLVLEAIAHHHERWDGLRYPFRRRGPEIPLLGRILALADACAAMIQDRPYRKGRGLQEVVDEPSVGAGTQCDPALVEPFVTTLAAVVHDAAYVVGALVRDLAPPREVA